MGSDFLCFSLIAGKFGDLFYTLSAILCVVLNTAFYSFLIEGYRVFTSGTTLTAVFLRASL
jgi:hypothetical protein